ncbi:MFS transporter [Deminuibacter soli]|uniref:MFS transporter n=1 Tax=Deminuibacter soli TaxID=2291815 RepID=A0A3E1NDQ6_9BACT|nr:MFS transporter [Deminuibacter soli]RFM25974.1 MFS transporter [Deminuibacter soli]
MNLSLSIDVNRSFRIATSVFFFIAGITFASWASRIPDIKNQLHLNDAGWGSVLFALPVGLMCSLPISGWAVAKFTSRKVLIFAALLYPLTLTLIGLATAVWQLVGILFFFGLWSNMFNIAVNTQAVGVENLYGRSIMASFHGLWSLAGFSGSAIGSFLVSKGMPPFFHFSLICAGTVVLVLASYRYTLPKDIGNTNQPVFAKPDAYIWKLGLIAFASLVSEGTMFDWSGIYFEKVVAVPKAYTTFGLVAFMSTMAGGRLAADWVVTRIGVTKVLQGSGVIITTGLLLSVLFPNIVTATIGFLLVGVGVSSVVPLVYGLAGKSKTMSPGVALAAVSTIGFLGFLVGPPMIGFIAQAASLRWSFTLIAVLGFGTTLLASKTRNM